MKTITFECETITPMFLAGADGRTPELRPPSIKGAMRFWWRAMNGHESSGGLKEKESKIFGGSGKNEGGSKVIIRIENNDKLNKGINIKNDYNLNCSFRNNQLEGKDCGIYYLLYSTILDKGRPYYKDKQNFRLNLMSNDFEALKEAAASLWPLIYFGGIGTRARRGGGNIAITNVIDKDNVLKETNLNFSLKRENANEIAEWLIKNYRMAGLIINEGENTKFISEYSNLSISRFIISNRTFNDWKEALNDIGDKFLKFRANPDNKRDIFEMAAFGLPVLHRNKKTIIIGGKIQNNKLNEISRRSSPLIFKILKSEDKYYWVVLRLAGEFFPDGKVIVSRRKGDKPMNYKTQAPNFDKLEEFWNELKKENREYILSIPYELEKIKEKIEQELSPKKIILFGSKARGDFHKNSDTDIAVDTDRSIELAGINEPVDIVNLKKIDKSFRDKIEREGIEL